MSKEEGFLYVGAHPDIVVLYREAIKVRWYIGYVGLLEYGKKKKKEETPAEGPPHRV